MAVLSPETVAATVREACRLEVQALKPGNVSVHAAGHRMHAHDFFRSAEAIAPVIALPGLTVGERILRSVEATIAEVGCNTNLGIVLLLAPLAHAVLEGDRGLGLRDRLGLVLRELTVADAVSAYRAIRLANPAGLGSSATQDVADAPTVTLLDAMRAAAQRDRIASQYASDYVDIFSVGVPAIASAAACGWGAEWTAVACYLRFASEFPDTHVVRKHGPERAEAVRARFRAVETHIKACDNPATAVPILLRLDNNLKEEGVNPGTSADLTVTSLAACRFDALLKKTN
ncbi:MAG: hypothetical protein NFCOHLIN_01643 [Gammaproteobacteria bacterium]|nr:hypothetical protein [Gammaproteobacteria bacterium]